MNAMVFYDNDNRNNEQQLRAGKSLPLALQWRVKCNYMCHWGRFSCYGNAWLVSFFASWLKVVLMKLTIDLKVEESHASGFFFLMLKLSSMVEPWNGLSSKKQEEEEAIQFIFYLAKLQPPAKRGSTRFINSLTKNPFFHIYFRSLF